MQKNSAQSLSEVKVVPPPCDFGITSPILRIDDVIPSRIEVLDEVIRMIVGELAQKGYVGNLNDVDLVMREALANAVIHGNRHSSLKAVRIGVALAEDHRLVIVVKDVGSGFDDLRVPDPSVGQHLLLDHGRGIFIMRQLTDQVEFRFEAGTEVLMTLRSSRTSWSNGI